ncbi:PqqD family protein, partial [Anaerovibrio slackiae]
VELTVENKGFFNRLAQKVFNRPAISYIQLDAIGSLVWLQLGQKDDVLSISEAVKEKFGQEAEPLLQRLGQFFNIMEQHQLIIRK